MYARFMKRLETLSDWVNIASKVIIVVVMVAMVAFTGFQVFCRYIFIKP